MDAIFHAVRADLDDPIGAWEEHITTLQHKSDELNAKKYHKLRFTSPGTDLTIELPEGHIWAQAGSHNEKGERFVANIPTEEVFTAPLKTGVNGTVRDEAFELRRQHHRQFLDHVRKWPHRRFLRGTRRRYLNPPDLHG